ncbi:MAG TPA: helix-turn-helix domain-containing protein [Tabrizicola sp.]
MPSKPYGMICALSKACEIIEPRWTLLILNEIWSGYTRFNDIRRAVGNISPGVLSKRLAELEKAGLIERVEDRAKGTVDYVRTPAGAALEPAMDALAVWAQRHIEAEVALSDSNIASMMEHFARTVQTAHFPARRVVMRLNFTDETGPYPTWWLVAEPGAVPEVCVEIPAVDVDLYIETSKLSWNALFYGRSTIARETDAGRLFLSGDALLIRTVSNWLPRSSYAKVDGIRMLPAAE